MRNLTGILAALLLGFLPLTLSCGAARRTYTLDGPSLVTAEPEGDFSPNTLIIMYDETVGKDPLLEAIETYGAEVKYDYSIIPGMAIRIPDGKDIRDAIAFFRKVRGVTSVERDRIIRLTDPVKPRLEVM